MAGEYKKGTLLQEYFLNPHFKPTEEEKKELETFFASFENNKITLDIYGTYCYNKYIIN